MRSNSYSDKVATPSPYTPREFHEIDYGPIHTFDISNADLSDTHTYLNDRLMLDYVAQRHHISYPFNGYLQFIAETTPSFVLSKYTLSVKDDGTGCNFLDFSGNDIPARIAIEYWKSLMTNVRIKLIFIYTSTCVRDTLSRHANWIIIDKPRKVVELFDPHGHALIETQLLYGKKSKWNVDLAHAIKHTFQYNEPQWRFIPKKYTILRYMDSCPLYGFQYYEAAFGGPKRDLDRAGYCAMWCIFLLELRLTNKSMSTRDVQEFLLQRYGAGASRELLGTAFRDFIRKYTHFLELHSGIRNLD